jgi:hypothetical protein
MIARGLGAGLFTQSCLVHALTISRHVEEASAQSQNLLAAAEATDNPFLQSHAVLAFGFANTDADPVKAYEVLGRDMAVTRETGNRGLEAHVAVILSRLATAHGDPRDAFEYLTLAIRNFYDSGSFSLMPSPLAILAAFFDRLGNYEPAATISGFAVNLLTPQAFPEIDVAITHLRDVLGEEGYETSASVGRAMTNAEMATYAFDQIDRARAQVSPAGESQ